MGKLVVGVNDLESQCKKRHLEDVLDSWDAEKNYPLTTSSVSFRSGKKAWWKCPICGMHWESKIANITNGHGCPKCGQKIAEEKRLKQRAEKNNLIEKWPELAKEWNYKKNDDLKPEDVSSSSKKKVWWICEKGHEWKQSINSRTGNHTKCPICNKSGIVIKGQNDFGTMFPELAKQWNYDRNELTPYDYPSTSSENVWWKCEKGHEWKQLIITRTNTIHKDCPICGNRKLLKGFNDLESQFPEVAKEWDYEQNKDKPSEIKFNSNKKVWWICSECGNHFQQRVTGRTNQHTGCPKCGSERRVEKFFNTVLATRESLADKMPELLAEWDYEKNIGIDPSEVLPGSNKKVWWKCKYGHSYSASIYNRVNGSGCPRCNLRATTSFPEQCVYYYVKKAFGDAVNEYRLKRKVYDVFIPSINVAIEYDGYKWHQDERDTKNDEEKNRICVDNGIQLYRIREKGSSDISSEGIVIIPCVYNDETSLKSAIENLLDMLGVVESVSIDRDRLEIQEQYYAHLEEKSLANRYPDIAKEWDYERNKSITPSMVHFGTRQKYWWKCEKGHEWEMSVSSRTHYGRGCPYCSGRKKLKPND